MQCVVISNGFLAPSSDPACPSDLYLLSKAEITGVDPGALGVTPQNVTNALAWGFGVVILFWGIGYGVGIAKRLIAKA